MDQLAPISGAGSAVAVQGQNYSIMNIIADMAVNPNADVQKLQALIAMQRDQESYEAVKSFNAAFAKMQAQMPVITHDKNIVHAKDGQSKKIATYAKFETINEVVRPILDAHGFALSFRTSNTPDGKLFVTAILTHRDGHSQDTTLQVPLDTSGAKNNIQGVGSAVSYGKRYALCCILNITTKGEDDDAAYFDARVSPAQKYMMEKLLYQLPDERQVGFCKLHGEPANVKKADFQKVLTLLEKAVKEESL